jgi:glycosyltransferase A (GT-A) superfamily protein (DUF2064 family)
VSGDQKRRLMRRARAAAALSVAVVDVGKDCPRETRDEEMADVLELLARELRSGRKEMVS